MRSFLPLSVLSLVLWGSTIVFAQHDSSRIFHKRTTSPIGKRTINSRRSPDDLTQRSPDSDSSELAALELINSTLTNKGLSTGTVSNISGSLTGSTTLKFPDLGFKMPSTVPSTTDGWWTDASEYAFMGFSYEVTACQSLSQLKTDFTNIRQKFKGRYIRLYGTCDNKGFYDNIVEAAWDATVGVHAIIWFGYNGGNQWQTRRDTLFAILKSNPKAKFVTRVVQFGSEPLFDSVLSPSALAAQVTSAKQTLQPLGIPVTVSDLVYGFTKNGAKATQGVLEAIDQISIHELPFFSTKATTGGAAWPLVESDIQWAMSQSALKGKKILFDENAWPSSQGSGVKANSAKAIASISQEQTYFNLLDSKCSYFKQVNIGWFMHIYSDDMEPEYGLYNDNGNMKFPFSPQTSC